MAAATRPKPIRLGLEPGLPLGFQRSADPALMASVRDHRNAERPQLRTVTRLRYEHPLHGAGLPRGNVAVHLHRQLHPGLGGQRDLPIDPGRLTASITLSVKVELDTPCA